MLRFWRKQLILILTLIMLAGSVYPVFAQVDLVNTTNVSTDQFEQGWQYSIKVYLQPDTAVEMSALEANVTFDNTIFYDVAISDQIEENSIWEADLVDAAFDINGDITTVKYLKANSDDDSWSVGSGEQKLLYILSFKVSADAALGQTNFNFDPNFAKVQNASGNNVTGQLIDADYYIVNPANGLIDLAITSNSGIDIFERNYAGGYNNAVKVVITPQADSKIKIIEATVTYNNTIFYDVTVADQQDSAIWENSIVNAAYDVSGDVTTIKYFKESTDAHELWEVNGSAEYALYYISFKVKPDAPLGATQFGSAMIEVTSNADEDILGAVSEHTYTIIDPANGDIDLVSTPNGNDGTYERNYENVPAGYSNAVKIAIIPQADSAIGALDATVTYNNTIFYAVSLADNGLGGSWAASTVNASYDVSGDTTTVKYAKEKSAEDRWNVSSGQEYVLYTLSFKVTSSAELGAEQIGFAPTIKFTDPVGQDITGINDQHAFTILTDNTTPNTTINITGDLFNAPQLINLSTDETGEEVTISYTLDGTDPKVSGTAITGARQISGILIPSVDGGILVTTLNYYAADWALDKAPNVETPYQTQVYTIDAELPTINILAYDPGPASDDEVIRVTFNIYDSSGEIWQDDHEQALVVQLGGQPMDWVSGSGIGNYVYERTLDDLVDVDGLRNIYISAKDSANNQATLTLSNAVQLDFNGPTLIVTATPNPAPYPQVITINVNSSETLQDPPTVSVSPEHYATFVRQDSLDYIFSFQVTANGWAVNVPWLAGGTVLDVIPPSVWDIQPTPSAVEISNIPTFSFNAADTDPGVNTAYILMEIDNAPVTSFNIMDLGGGTYNISYIPTNSIGANEEIFVTINVSDLLGNSRTATYSFTTLGPPAVTPVGPTANDIVVPVSSDIVFDVTDNDQVVTGSIAVTINGELAIINGQAVDTNNYNISYIPVARGYRVSIDPAAAFDFGTTSTIDVYVEDVANNFISFAYSFTTTGSPDILPPTIQPVIPLPDDTLVPTSTPIIIYLEDNSSGITTGSIYVTVNGASVMEAGIVSGGYGIAEFVASGDAYTLSITPNTPFLYISSIYVEVEAQDDLGNTATLSYTFETEYNPSGMAMLWLKVYLQGYYDPFVTNTQKPATVDVQIRATVTGSALLTSTLALDSNGESVITELTTLPPRSYYVAIFHKLPGYPAGVNHIPVVIAAPLAFGGDYPTIIDLRTTDNIYYHAPYISTIHNADGEIPDPLYTEINGKRSMRSGNTIFDGDNAVNVVDFNMWNDEWLSYAGEGSPADLNADGVVDTLDFALWSANNQHAYPTEY